LSIILQKCSNWKPLYSNSWLIVFSYFNYGKVGSSEVIKVTCQ
jgi:hypothetical protein